MSSITDPARPRDDAYAALWLSEMWQTVPEYGSNRKPTTRPTTSPPPSKTRKRMEDRLVCPFCSQSFVRTSLPRHLSRIHSAEYEEVG